ncbi:MAG: lactonase family protein [Gammaproteobacteria bacterium]
MVKKYLFSWVIMSRISVFLLAGLILPCSADPSGVTTRALFDQKQVEGAVFVMTNATDPIRGNEIVMYNRFEDGTLSVRGYFPTGGLGSGPATIPNAQSDGLGSQGSLITTRNGKWLFAANAGSDEISVFRVRQSGLIRTAKVHSGGGFPISLTYFRNVLYVLNAGGDANITGFRFGPGGTLSPIANSTRSLETGGTNPPFLFAAPGQVGFSPDGRQLVIAVKELGGPGRVVVYAVGPNGVPSVSPVTRVGTGELPFAFTYDRSGHLLVSEIFGRIPDMLSGSAVSSYNVASNGQLQVIDDSVPNFQGGACWIITVGRYAYVSNTFVHTLSGYEVTDDGSLILLDSDGVTATTIGPTFPLDMGATSDGRYLYVVLPGTGKVGIWAIEFDGSLTPIGEAGGLEPSPDVAPTEPFSSTGGSPAGLAVVNFRITSIADLFE